MIVWFWMVGASLTLTYLVLNKIFTVVTGRLRVHGISTTADWVLLAYQEFNEALKTALAWPMTIPLGMIMLLMYLRKHNIDSVAALTDDALQNVHIGQIAVPPRGEREDAQSEEMYRKLQLELDAALGVPPLVMVWPLLTLAWEQMDDGLVKHPIGKDLHVTLAERRQYFLKVVSFMLLQHASAEESDE